MLKTIEGTKPSNFKRNSFRVPKFHSINTSQIVTSKQFDIVDLEVEDVDLTPSCYLLNSFTNAPLMSNRKSRVNNFNKAQEADSDNEHHNHHHKLLNVGRLTMELPESTDLNESHINEKFDVNSSTTSIHTSIDSSEAALTQCLLGNVP